ncbi:terpene cyclase/mutase family protein [Planctomycetota bacterium]|nr:terpene cyclase/mutase family protein [Planctomycetota bacterium]
MGKKRYEDESYSDCEDGYYDDAELHDGDFEQPDENSRRNRLIALFSTSYGVSIAAHVGILILLALWMIAVPQADEVVKIVVQPGIDPPPFQEELDRDVKDVPPTEVEVTEPVELTDLTEVEISSVVPKGSEFEHSTKHLDSHSVDDAFGVAGQASGAYGSRFGTGHATGENGVPPGAANAVRAALRWLQFHQSPDGRWDTDGWQASCPRGRCSGPGYDVGDPRYDVGVTSLALLAFLGNGNTHRFAREDAFKVAVQRGLSWLKRQQAQNGAIGYDPGHGESIYNHAIATMALCEAYAITRDFTLKRYAEAAVRFCVDAQNPGLGWRYGVRSGRNDTSVTGWLVLALKAAKTAELDVPESAFTGALTWFDRATNSTGNTGYLTPGGGSSFLGVNENKYAEDPCMTAVSVVCRLFSGQRNRDEPVRLGARILSEQPPKWHQGTGQSNVNFYYWYYGTYAMFQVGGAKWDAWNEAMLEALLPTQRKGGCDDGSWDSVGPWCVAGGRVYATAINALTLEIYYRYNRAQDETK